MSAPASVELGSVRKSWWREAEAAWLVLLVIAAYFIRAGELPIRGEEPTRAQIAREMVERGDWVVPRVQGDPFRIRPPLQNWLIATSCLVLGNWDAWAVRCHAVCATLLTTLLIYGYARTCLTRAGAFAAAAAFATLADMFQMGRQAETEALFILLVSAALLSWHWGIMRRWPEAVTWSAGYSFMALAMLTKGLQAPTYFIAATSIYLFLSGQLRRLVSAGHVVGLLAGMLILGAWVLPYARAEGWTGVHAAWLGDPAVRLQNWNALAVLTHLVTYPCEIAAGTLPWSLLLVVYLKRDFRRALGAARPHVLFLGICLAVAFPTCWIHPGGQPRFFAPLLPCLAVLIGVAVERCAAADAGSPLRAAWRRYLTLVAATMILAAAAACLVAACRGMPLFAAWVEPPLVTASYVAISAWLATLTLRARRGGAGHVRLAVAACAGFLVMTFTGIVTDVRLRRSENAAAAMQALKDCLPPGHPLVSLDGHIDCLFSYYYGPPFIQSRPLPATADDAADLAYFCLECPGEHRPTLPFAWQEIGIVSLDRNHRPVPERIAVVGRRLPGPAAPVPGTTVSRQQ